MVFYIVVSPSLEHFGNLCPFVAILLMGLKHHFLFFGTPSLFVDGRIQMIMPSNIHGINTSLCTVCQFCCRYHTWMTFFR